MQREEKGEKGDRQWLGGCPGGRLGGMPLAGAQACVSLCSILRTTMVRCAALLEQEWGRPPISRPHIAAQSLVHDSRAPLQPWIGTV